MPGRVGTATVGEVVAGDFRTASVFQRFGIDFCCGGHRSIADACREAQVAPAIVLGQLDALEPAVGEDSDERRWPIERLIDHITSVHHGYVRQALPTITAYLQKLEQVHGTRHPELAVVNQTFGRMSRELEQHMLKEEHVLFPYVRGMAEAEGKGRAPWESPFGSVRNPIQMMEREHEDAGGAVRHIRELTNGYVVPSDGCTTYRVCLAELDRFERDLHRHVHLENNILFPRASALELVLCARA